jgi:hypothetical protein
MTNSATGLKDLGIPFDKIIRFAHSHASAPTFLQPWFCFAKTLSRMLCAMPALKLEKTISRLDKNFHCLLW